MKVVNLVKERANQIIRGFVGVPNRQRIPALNTTETLIFLRKLDKLYGHTPDWFNLEQSQFQRVFIYCEVGKGGSNNEIISNIQRTYGDGVREMPSYIPWAMTEGVFEVWQTRDVYWTDEQGQRTDKIIQHAIPIALTSRARKSPLFAGTVRNLPQARKLRGHVYFIRSDLMNILDNYKKNGVLYRRRLMTVDMPVVGHGRIEHAIKVKAWIYLGRHKHWDPQLDGGFNFTPCRIFENKGEERWVREPFYYFCAARVFREGEDYK